MLTLLLYLILLDSSNLLHNFILQMALANCQSVFFLASVPLEGKESVCKAEVVPIFVQLLEDEDAEVRANAAGALMFTTITTQGKASVQWWYDNSAQFPSMFSLVLFSVGKYAALHSGAIPKLLALVKDNHSKVRLNCIKALTTLSETPEGRKVLLPDVNLIQECLSDSSEVVSRAAAIAEQVIQWKP